MPSVLVVDDYADTRQLLEHILTSQGYDVFTAKDGEEGMIVALEKSPDAIIMDIFMPRMDGLAASHRLKADPRTAETPIIAYTARPSPLESSNLFAAVCKKPCSPDELLDHLENALRDVQQD